MSARGEVGWDTSRWGPGYRTERPVTGQPACPACGGRLVSTVVNFGDALPARELRRAAEHARRSDVMLALGSSLTVEPAASLVRLARVELRRTTLPAPLESLTFWLVPSTRPGAPRGELRLAWGTTAVAADWSLR